MVQIPANSLTSIPLGELCLFQSGGTPTKSCIHYWNGTIPWVTSAEINGGVISTPRFHVTNEGLENSAAVLVPKNTLLLVTRTGVGKVAFTETETTFNQDICAVIPDSKRLDKRYLFRFLDSRQQYFKQNSRGAVIKGITRFYLNSLGIPIPYPDDPNRSLQEQRRIAAILDKADTIRRKREEARTLNSELPRSVFLEMFGDPVKNQKGWKECPVVDLCEKPDDIRCGPFGTQLKQHEFTRTGVPLWGIKHVNRGFQIETDEFVHPDKAKELNRYTIEPGDIVMTRKGTIGNCHIYPTGKPTGVMHSDLLRLRLCQSKASAFYIVAQFAYSRSLRKQLELMSPGAVMPGINVSKLKQLSVLRPPIEMQNEFATRARALEVHSSQQLKFADEMDSLFGSLVQRAFRGEL